MKTKHELQLMATVKQLMEKQGENVTNFEKQNKKIEAQQIFFNTQLEDLERKNAELTGQVESQNVANDHLNEKLNEVERKNVVLDEKVETLSKKLETIEKDNFKLIEKVKTQNVILEKQNEAKIELDRKVDEIEKTKQDIENQLKDHENKIEALTLFSKDLSRLHLTLSHPNIRYNRQQYFFFYEGEYKIDTNEDIRNSALRWNTFTKEITERDEKFDGCEFLQNLKKSIQLYSTSVYPNEHSLRYKLCIMNKFYDLSRNNLKIPWLFNGPYISFKVCNTTKMYRSELQTKNYVQHNDFVASYIDIRTRCLNVIIGGRTPKHILLIHPTDINKTMVVPADGTQIKIHDHKTWNIFGFYLFYLHC